MRRLLASLALALLASVASAQSVGTTAVTVSWTLPTTYPDGTAMPASDVLCVHIGWLPHDMANWHAASGSEWFEVGTAPANPALADSCGTLGTQWVAAPPTSASIAPACGDVDVMVEYLTSPRAHVPDEFSTPIVVEHDTGLACPGAAVPGGVKVKWK